MKQRVNQAGNAAAAVIALVCLAILVQRAQEPVYKGKVVRSWINQMGGVAVKVVELPNVTNVFLANLTDKEIFALNDWNPKLYFVPGNAAMAYSSYPNNGSLNGEGQDSCGFYNHVAMEADPAIIAIKSLGAAAVPGLISAIGTRDSMMKDFVNRRIWPRLPAFLRSAVGSPIHPAHTRMKSAYALGLLGAEAKSAVPHFRRLTADTNAWVRATAVEALQRIQPQMVGTFHPELFGRAPDVAKHPRELANPTTTNSLPDRIVNLVPNAGVQQGFLESELEGRRHQPKALVTETTWHLRDVGLLPARHD